ARATPVWSMLDIASALSRGGAKLQRQPDGSVLATGKNPSPETYVVTARTKLAGITAIRLEVLSDMRLPSRGPGRAPNGNFVLNEWGLSARAAGGSGKPHRVPLHRAQATFSQEGFPVGAAIDGNPATGWAVVPQTGRSHTAFFELKAPLANPAGTVLTFT